MVEAAGVESEVDTLSIRVYDDLPNVYRMTDIYRFGKLNLITLWV